MRTALRWSAFLLGSAAAAWLAGGPEDGWMAWGPCVVLVLVGAALTGALVGRAVAPATLLAMQAGRNGLAVLWILVGQGFAADGRAFVRAGLATCLVLMVGEIVDLVWRRPRNGAGKG